MFILISSIYAKPFKFDVKNFNLLDIIGLFSTELLSLLLILKLSILYLDLSKKPKNKWDDPQDGIFISTLNSI